MTPPARPATGALLRRLLGWMRPYRGRIAASLLCMAAVSALTAVTLALVKPLVDGGLFARPATEPERLAAFTVIWRTLALAVAATALKSLAQYGVTYLVGWTGQRVIVDLRLAVFARLQRLSLRWYHGRKTGELLSRVVADVAAMQNMLTQLFGPAASSLIMIAGLTGLLLWTNWTLALGALLVFPVAVWPIRRFGRRMRTLSRQVQDLAGDLTAHLEEALAQVKLVQAYQGEERELARWRGKLGEQLGVAMRALRVQARSSPIMETIGIVGFAAIMIYAGWAILLKGTMTGGSLMVFAGGVLRLYPEIKHLNGLWNNIQAGLGAAERVFPLLDEVPDIADAPGAVPLAAFASAIRYEDVTFEFRPGEPVLRGIGLDLPRGSRVALVGPSGAGKTTLADLLLRFYDPTRGRITVDGKDLKSATLASVRGRIALVSQETLLFNATVAENLRYARPGATAGQMEEAARAAGAHGFIAAMPEGYATVIGDRGMRLSGGERQRLSIARAFLKDAPILILDEATAALDAASEQIVQDALESLMANRTVLIIAHRLATVRKADAIAVLDRGAIVERGTHDELYARGGLYRRLCDLQFSDAPGPAAAA